MRKLKSFNQLLISVPIRKKIMDLKGINYFLNWISALVKEMGGKTFPYCDMTLPAYFGLDQVKNIKNMYDFRTK